MGEPMSRLTTLATDAIANLVTHNRTDEQLIEALRTGQTDALGEIYDRYASLVYNLALRLLRNANEAEDLTQEVFMALPRLYDGKRGSLGTFLSMVTRSRAIDRLRKRNNRRQILTRWQNCLSPTASNSIPFEQAAMAERRDQVQQALAQLPENHRRVLELSYYEGLSQSEIAQHLGTPLGTVKSWARRGLLKLEQNLQGFLNEDLSDDSL